MQSFEDGGSPHALFNSFPAGTFARLFDAPAGDAAASAAATANPDDRVGIGAGRWSGGEERLGGCESIARPNSSTFSRQARSIEKVRPSLEVSARIGNRRALSPRTTNEGRSAIFVPQSSSWNATTECTRAQICTEAGAARLANSQAGDEPTSGCVGLPGGLVSAYLRA